MSVDLVMSEHRDARRAAAEQRAQRVAHPVDRPSKRRSREDASTARVFAPLTRAVVDDDDSGGLAFYGTASVTDRFYPMWDVYGEYDEVVHLGSFTETLAQPDLDVPLVIGHDQFRRIARIGSTESPLLLTEATKADDEGPSGLRTVAPSLPRDDVDVKAVVPKIRAGLIDEMSFAFRITSGRWNEEFDEFHIHAVDLHRGDVAIVGYGANPFTEAKVRVDTDKPFSEFERAERRRLARLALARAGL